ncbi:MAG: radical SAM protein [Nitrospinota bacterium]|nr:radical SAM protein [Nitrospinota bacterium]
MKFQPEVIYIEQGADDYTLTREVLRRFSDAPVLKNVDAQAVMDEINKTATDTFGTAKKRLLLSRFKGSFLKKCPGISSGMVCCNYYIVNLMTNCIYDCSYCVLQDFLENNPLLTAFVNVEDILGELDAIFEANPDRFFRVGTGEAADSLAMDDVIPHSELLVPFFNKKKNAVLELKTKSACIENLLRQDDATNVIVSWSVNPQEIIDQEEKLTAGLEERLDAAFRCQSKGYRIGFHFDPVIIFPGWECAYRDLVDLLFKRIQPEKIEWVSLGSFRYRPNLKKIMKERHPDTRLFDSEHVVSEDGKFRYLRPMRNRAYAVIQGYLKEYSGSLPVYFCMETKEIWEDVTGKLPRSDKKLDQFFDL